MRKLLIVDPTLISLEGHSFNYDAAICEAARGRFDQVVVYADRHFSDPSGRIADCRPVLNRLRLEKLKRAVNALFHPFRRRSGERAGHAAHSTIVPNVWPWLIRAAKALRAADLSYSMRRILREHEGAEVHLLLQHAHFSELVLADRLDTGPGVHLHLVLRYSPDLVNSGQMPGAEFGRLLARLGESRQPRVHLYTDSERLSGEYAALSRGQVTTLPVPLPIAEVHSPEKSRGDVSVAFLGASRVEKGFCELPALIERFPPGLRAMVQVARDSADPRIRTAVGELDALATRLPGRVELLESPVPSDVYYRWIASTDIVALPYLSTKYNASTSGIFVEAVCFGVPVICPAESWMADVMRDAAQNTRLRIGEVIATVGELPAAAARIAASLDQYRAAVGEFARIWRKTHNADECVNLLLRASAS